MDPKLALVAALALAAAGCGSGDDRAVAVARSSLLARTPDGRVAQDGRLTVADLATDVRDWGAGGQWIVADVPEHGPVAFSRGQTVWLHLAAVEPVDRTLVVELCTPGEDRPEAAIADSATLALNGFALGTVELGRAPRRFELEAPAALWRAGDNVLRIAAAERRRLDAGASTGAASRGLGVGLVELAYDVPRPVTVDPATRRVTLSPDTAVRYAVHPDPGAGLEVAGHCEGDGELVLSLGAVDPATGTLDEDRFGTHTLVPEDGAFAGALALPAVDDAILSIAARWRGEPASGATLTALELVSPAAVARPSVLFVSIDTLSARHLSAYGYARPTSPTLERLAEEGVLFERCIANAPWTLHSYMSQFSGLFPYAHRRVDEAVHSAPTVHERYNLAPNRWTLAEALRAGGYATAAWVDNPWLEPSLGLDQGFELFDRSMSERDLWDTSGGIDGVCGAFEAWLDGRDDDRPFFALLQALDPHAPYVGSSEYADLFADDALYDREREELVGVGFDHVFGVIPEHAARTVQREGALPERLPTRPLVDAYDRKVRHVDDALGRLFEGLRERGVWDELLVVVSSDHGESLLTHGFYFGHATLYDETLHVPLIFKLPGGAGAGRRVPTTVQLVDLYPTLVDLAGLPRFDFLRGRSLAPALAGEPLEPSWVWSEGGIGEQYAVEHRGWKLIMTDHANTGYPTKVRHPRLSPATAARLAELLGGGVHTADELEALIEPVDGLGEQLGTELGPALELYHLTDDPLELFERGAVAREKLAALRDLAVAVIESNIADAANASEVAEVIPLDDARRAQLAALGYLEDRGDRDEE